MKGIWCCLLVMLLHLLSAAENSWLQEIRRDHPRLFFNRDTWPVVRDRALGAERQEYERMLKRVESYPDDPVCSGYEAVEFREVKTASGTHRVTANTPIGEVKEWGRQASECAFVWRITQKPEHLEKARRMLVSSVRAYRQAIANGRAVSWYSTKRILAIAAYDWIYEGLTPEQRREIIVPLLEHVQELMPEQRKGKKIVRLNSSGVTTGFYGVESLLWYAGLAAYGDGYNDDLAEQHLKRGYEWMCKLMQYRADSSGDDGGLSSGVHGYCMGAYPWAHFNFFHTYLSATGKNIASQWPHLALFPNWIYWNMIPDSRDAKRPYSFGFGDDAHANNKMSVHALYEHTTQYIHFFKDIDPASARLAASLRELAPTRHLTSNWPFYPFILHDAPEIKPYSLPQLQDLRLKARHFESLGQIVMRSGWRDDSVYCLFTSGAKLTQHKHYDENNFVIYHHGFLALDSGTRAMESDFQLRHYYAQTVAHNCILIHKPDEKLPGYWGMKYSQGPEGDLNHGGMLRNKSQLRAFHTQDDFSYVAGDATQAYGPKCSEAIRQFVHVQPDCFVVYDRVTATQPQYRKEWLLHTQHQPHIKDNILQAEEMNGRLFSQTLLPRDAVLKLVGGPGREFWASGKNWELDAKYLDSLRRHVKQWGREPLFGNWRLEVSPREARASDQFLHVLSVGRKDGFEKAPSAQLLQTETQDGVVIDHPDGRRIRILFNRSGAISASLWIERDGQLVQSATLGETIQPQSGSSVP